MGIPSYFSHIIKNHNIIMKKDKLTSNIHNFYIDSNSIIYDVIHTLEYSVDFNIIYKAICEKLLFYINQISPTNTVIVSFDGVAPIAKLSQQRTRRVKNIILKQLNNKLNSVNKYEWDTTQITPGTPFMISLNQYVTNYFDSIPNKKYNIILSLTNDIGEGEHKIFNHIRCNTNHIHETTVVYGLDADLIMLSLLHTKYCDKIFLYRETPQFIKNLDHNLNASELYILCMNTLANKIIPTMTHMEDFNETQLITDYVFICFLLGNDFIPHNPAINIRTNGIDILCEIYNKYFKGDNYIIENDTINWKHFKHFCKYISDEEEEYIKYEYTLRNKYEKRFYKNQTFDEKQNKLNNLPTINRQREHYINPNTTLWQNRYYSTLFDIEYNTPRLQQICFNYLEALEWTWKYYSSKCYDWRWKYNYDYAPLFEDIIKYIPYYNFNFIKEKTTHPIKELTQLIYVLPEESHYLLPNNVKTILNDKFKIWFDKSTIDFKWDFCKYLWESHLTLPEIDINTIEHTFNLS
tara:strand:+ start:3944 stop:5506 length:1563 start_codon:yes stop_codon:yes gene_type:complete